MNSRQESNYIIEKNISKYFLFATVILFCFGGVLQTQAVGISPSFIEIENIVNGNSVERQLNISRSDVSIPQQFGVSVSGDGARYIVLPEPSLIIPKGEHSTDYTFYVEPKDAPNGEYTAKIYFVSEKYEGDEGSRGSEEQSLTQVILGIVAHLSFTLTDEDVVDYDIQFVRMDDVEVGGDVMIRYLLRNNGNVNIQPDRVDVRLIDTSDEEHIIEETIFENNIPSTAPFDHAESVISMTEDIPQGMYSAEVTFYDDGEVKHRKETFLNIYPLGTLAQQADFVSLVLNGEIFDVRDTIQLEASIQNSGDVAIEPVMHVEISREGKVIDLIRSDKKLLPKKNGSTYSLTFRPEKDGEYSLGVYFEYGIKQTERKHAKIMVEAETAVILWILRVFMFVLPILFLFLVPVWFIVRFVRRRGEVEAIVSTTTPPPELPPSMKPQTPAKKSLEWPSL